MDLLQILQAGKEIKRDKILEIDVTEEEIKKLIDTHVLIECADGTYEVIADKIKEETNSDFAWKLYEYYFAQKNKDLALEALNTYVKLCKEEKKEIDYNKILTSKIKISNLNVPYAQIVKEKELAKSIKVLLQAPITVNNINELELLVEKFCKLNQNRNFYSDYYRGKFYSKTGQYSKAIEKYKEIVNQDPDNYIVWSKLTEIYNTIGRRNEWNHAICQVYRLTAQNNTWVNIEMSKIYFKDGNYTALNALLDTVYENPNLERMKIFQYIFRYINTQLSKTDDFHDYFGYGERSKIKYQKIEEILNSIEEKANTLLVEKSLVPSNIELELNTEESKYSKAYNALYDFDQDMIVPSKLLNHLKDQEILKEEDYLLCLSAASILFENNMPNYAEKYLKLVAESKDKTETVKEALNQTVKNKKLYLNR